PLRKRPVSPRDFSTLLRFARNDEHVWNRNLAAYGLKRPRPRQHSQRRCRRGGVAWRSCAFAPGVFAPRGENGREQRSFRDHFRHEHIRWPTRYSGWHRERAQPNKNSYLHIHPSGAVLTLNAQEATERINGKLLLAEGVADSIADLTKKAGLTGNVVTIEPTGFEQIAFWITALAPLLLLLGILGAYLEFKIPGVMWPGIISAVCFALFFLGHYLVGLAGWEVVALFILGMVLVLIEILFFAHTTIVFGVVVMFLMLA